MSTREGRVKNPCLTLPNVLEGVLRILSELTTRPGAPIQEANVVSGAVLP